MDKYLAHILVVDDDDRIRELVKQYLIENKYLVTTAKDAFDAKSKIEIIKFDIIVLDIMMPKKNGLELTAEIKKEIDLPIILYAGHVVEAQTVSAVESESVMPTVFRKEDAEMYSRFANKSIPIFIKIGTIFY